MELTIEDILYLFIDGSDQLFSVYDCGTDEVIFRGTYDDLDNDRELLYTVVESIDNIYPCEKFNGICFNVNL